MVEMKKWRDDFPILDEKVNGKTLVYLDNGATAQKPSMVIKAIEDYYNHYNSNIHRGVHHLSQVATLAYEQSRDKVQSFINAKNNYEVIFTTGTTGGINLVAQTYGRATLKAGDEVLISYMEHHSNIVPWQMICEETGAELKVIPINVKGELIWEEFLKLLSNKTKILSITHISNTLGTINPVEQMIKEAHKFGTKVLVDAAQSVPHLKLDVQDLDCDFLVFSGHKMFGPTGVGVLYGKEELLNSMPPYQGGGDMIKEVTFGKTTYNCLPHKFEAGTPNIAGGIGLAKAIEYMDLVGMDDIQKQEHQLLEYCTAQLMQINGLRIIGTSDNKASVISFVIEGLHPFDIGTLLDQMGIAVRTGHHCTQPLMDFFEIPGTVRASFAFYNTLEEVDEFIKALKKAIMMLT
ncbi:MAG: cysteine desulfurase [Flavobacteriales bacterium]|nr:cysteine desulfurase [Flavobacteriales bacterium]